MSDEHKLDRLINVYGIYATMFGLFAGFTFTATLFLIQAKLNFPFIDYLIGACGGLTIDFIFVTISFAAKTLWNVHADAERSRKYYVAARYLGLFGLLALIALIIFMLFITYPIAGWITFAVFLAILIGNVVYFGRTLDRKIDQTISDKS